MSAAPPVSAIHFDRCELRLDTRELRIDGQLQPVRKRVFDLMAFLIAQRPRAVSHRELLRALGQRDGGSPKMLARAVMEARRACGDSADEPRLFVTVHAVGYRFAGGVAEGPAAPLVAAGSHAAPSAAAGAEDAEAAEAEEGAAGASGGVGGTEAPGLLQQAKAALDAGRTEQAQFFAEQALMQATQAQSNSDRVRALVMCSTLTLRRGAAPAAARLAAQALQIARAEGQPVLVAQARVAVGFVHLLAGDRALAMRHFQESREALAVPGCEADLMRCLSYLAAVFRELGNPDTALQLGRDSMALARRIGSENAILTERGNETVCLMSKAERLLGDGQAAQAQATLEEALTRVDALLADIQAAGGAAAIRRQPALGNRAVLLDKLGRLDEAWEALGVLQDDLARTGLPDSPVFAERQQLLLTLRAGLLARRGRPDEALADLQRCIDSARQRDQTASLPRLFGLASDLCRQTGRLEQALDWAQQQMQAQRTLQASAAATLTCIVEAELNTDELQSALDRARDQVATLLRENAELRLRARLLEGVVPVSPATGLAAAEVLGAVFSSPFRHARGRGLPMCLGLLDLDHADALASAHPPEVMQALLRQVAELLRLQPDIAQPAVQLGAGQVVFHIRDAGLARADEVCSAVVAKLHRPEGLLAGLGLAPVWRCRAADAAAVASVDDCVIGLQQRVRLAEGALAGQGAGA